MIGGEMGRPASNSTGPGTPMPIPHSRPGSRLRRPEQRVEQRVDAVEADAPARPRSGGLVVVTEDPAVEGRDRHVDARRAEVGDEDVAAVGPERQLARRAPAGARSDVALGDQPALDELADALGDDRPTRDRSARRAPSASATARAGSRRGRRRARRAPRPAAGRTGQTVPWRRRDAPGSSLG